MRTMREHVVIKLGGASLFNPGGFQSELNCVLQAFQHCKIYLLVGGGELVEAIRSLHRIYPTLDSVSLHWRCIELLEHTCQIVTELSPCIPMIRTLSELNQYICEPQARMAWISPQSFYQRYRLHEMPMSWLPRESWETTSDALAWLLAMKVTACRLVLLKRGISAYQALTLEHAASLGIIDPEIVRLFQMHTSNIKTIELREIGSGINHSLEICDRDSRQS